MPFLSTGCPSNWKWICPSDKSEFFHSRLSSCTGHGFHRSTAAQSCHVAFTVGFSVLILASSWFSMAMTIPSSTILYRKDTGSRPRIVSLYFLTPTLLGIWSHHFMANRWGNSGNSVRLYFWGLQITADGDWSHETKRRLLLGRKVMTNLDSILKSRDIILSTKVCLVKAMVFPVVMYGCESWTVKKAEHRRIDAFELWCWRRLLRIPWTARRSNLSILKEISPWCLLEGLML